MLAEFTWFAGVALGSLASLWLLEWLIEKRQPGLKFSPFKQLLIIIRTQINKPFVFIFLIYVIYISLVYFLPLLHYPLLIPLPTFTNICNIAVILCLIWLTVGIIDRIGYFIDEFYAGKKYIFTKVIFPSIAAILKVVFALFLLRILINYLIIPDKYLHSIEKILTLFLIISGTWLAIKFINIFSEITIERYTKDREQRWQARKIVTQIIIFKRIIIVFIIGLGLSFVLLSFDRLWELGATLLASAGIIAAVATFAAQKTLATIFAGIQVALTQPIRINDMIFVENELGTVEEITFQHVIVKTWDLRRLILPINYFVERHFQNWTRQAKNLIGTIFIYVDYKIPLDELREKLYAELNSTPLWDKKTAVLQMSDVKMNSVELRALVSADDAIKLWDLRCLIREKLVAYIFEKYPESLPIFRIDKEFKKES